MFFEETTRTLIKDLNSHYKGGAFNNYEEKDIGYIMSQIFSILNYLHYKDYVHRDIKPEKFLISADDYKPLKLVSLGTIKKRE